ncbi:hypothetical protein R20233_00507 [Ralstonia sp. LMG 32965]|nr:hypothetical protein R20233_00507 [Ralstonia sp. LMG 32965]
MPETPWACTPPGYARRLGHGRSTPLEQPYPFLRKPGTTRPAQRLAYPFLRVPSQKQVHISEYPRVQDDKATAYPFLRIRGELVRTRFCARLRSASGPTRTRFCVKARIWVYLFLRTPTQKRVRYFLQAATPSPWLIRLFTRRNRYGGLRPSVRGLGEPRPVAQVSAMKVLILPADLKPGAPGATYPCADRPKDRRRNGYA